MRQTAVKDGASDIPDALKPSLLIPRVYIVSDIRLHREGLILGLDRQSQLTVLGAGSSGEVLNQIRILRPDVLLLDLGARDSLTIPRRAQLCLPTLRVVAFAVAEVPENVLACAEAGISGYVAQDGSMEDLIAVVLRVLQGELVCSPQITAVLFDRIATLSSGRSTMRTYQLLTRREREIVALIACNLPNKEIARRLYLCPATVKNHVHNILQKLNINRRSDIARHQIQWSGSSAVPPMPQRISLDARDQIDTAAAPTS
jgi:DNA-binding NarL/FixJ family response regulator